MQRQIETDRQTQTVTDRMNIFLSLTIWAKTDRDRQTDTDRQTDRDRQKDRQTETERETHRERKTERARHLIGKI